MANTSDEAKKYIFANWRRACQVEETLKEIRGIVPRVVKLIQYKHRELDHATPISSFDDSEWSGYIGVRRNEWYSIFGEAPWIYIYNLRPDYLLNESCPAPRAGIYAGKKPRQTELEQIRRRVGELLTKDELDRCQPPTDHYVLNYKLPEDRRDLVGMLLEGDGQRFVDCLVGHFEVFAKLIPTLNEVFSKPNEE